MTKKNEESLNISDDDPLELIESLSQEQKLSRKQRLMKLFLTTELKNKHLWKPLGEAKSSLIRNFRHWTFKSSDINKFFWIYFNEGKKIYIAKHLKKYLPKYKVDMWWDFNDMDITLQQYLLLLKHIKIAVDPFVEKVQPIIAQAEAYALAEMKNEFPEDSFTEYQWHDEKEFYRNAIKKRLLELMPAVFDHQNIYTADRFEQEKDHVYDKLIQGDTSAVIVFALLWFYLFGNKHEVYNTFSAQELDTKIQFISSSDSSFVYPIALRDLLTLILQLDFKSKFFKMK